MSSIRFHCLRFSSLDKERSFDVISVLDASHVTVHGGEIYFPAFIDDYASHGVHSGFQNSPNLFLGLITVSDVYAMRQCLGEKSTSLHQLMAILHSEESNLFPCFHHFLSMAENSRSCNLLIEEGVNICLKRKQDQMFTRYPEC